MPPRETKVVNINTESLKGRKSTQRERLLDGMLAVANRNGYVGASVSQVIAHAGVSRPTFYDYFADRDDCFLATHRHLAERLLDQVRRAVAVAPSEQAIQSGVRALLQYADSEPAQARFLMHETMAAGSRALDERDRTIVQIEQLIERARRQEQPRTPTPDLPTRALIGGLYWLLAPPLRRGEHDFTILADELVQWIESYNQPAGTHRWRTLQPGPPPQPSPYVSELSLQAPPPISPGRSRLSAAEIARNQRERILFATAEVAAQKGYTAATIADITATARVDRRVLYSHFRDKQQAFLAVHEIAFQQTLAVAAGAFFSASAWPERVWRGILAINQFNATHPTIAHIRYLEAHAVGTQAVQRIDDNRQAFTIFLQEGIQRAARPTSRTATEAIAATIFEITYLQVRQHLAERATRLTYHATYLALAPFLGPRAANKLIDEKLREAGAESAA
jgi:AcrR family transcriptional regulator